MEVVSVGLVFSSWLCGVDRNKSLNDDRLWLLSDFTFDFGHLVWRFVIDPVSNGVGHVVLFGKDASPATVGSLFAVVEVDAARQTAKELFSGIGGHLAV